jgi:hypothetical protein
MTYDFTEILDKFSPHTKQIELAEKQLKDIIDKSLPHGLALNLDNGEIQMIKDSYDEVIHIIEKIKFHKAILDNTIKQHNHLINIQNYGI